MKGVTDVRAWWDLAIALHGEGRYAEALDCMHAVEKHQPDSAVVLAGLGVAYRDSGDLVRGENYSRRACALRPDEPSSHFNLALTLLRAGKLREGFDEYEWRWQVQQFREQRRDFSQPLWQGEPLNGRRILIYAEQGAGDAIQFVRYAPLVRAAGGDVIIEVLPHMERLMSWMKGEYRIVNQLSDGLQFDIQCPLMSLPQRFGTELHTIPSPACFSIPAVLTKKWTARLQTGGKKAGVVWAGNPNNDNDAARSMPADYLVPLTRFSGIKLCSLQVGEASSNIPEGIESLAEHLTDFGDTAAAIAGLDLIITVDTAVAHLAGSLGKPVWLLVPYASDWRWMLNREDSPWYSSMRILRQQSPGAWGEVIDHVGRELMGSV